MPMFSDRVRDVTTSTGTGPMALNGTPPTGMRTFAAGFGSAATVVAYVIQGTSEWEVGDGVFNGTTGLSRDLVRASSNSGGLVNFSAGSKDVFCAPSAELLHRVNVGHSLPRTLTFL